MPYKLNKSVKKKRDAFIGTGPKMKTTAGVSARTGEKIKQREGKKSHGEKYNMCTVKEQTVKYYELHD